MTITRWPCAASAAARFTAVVVLPTPPFWFAIVMIRRCAGRGRPSVPSARMPTTASPSRAPPVDGSPGVSCETSVRVSVTALPPHGHRSDGPRWSSAGLHCARWRRGRRRSRSVAAARGSPAPSAPAVRGTHRLHDRGRRLEELLTAQQDLDLGDAEPIQRWTGPLDLVGRGRALERHHLAALTDQG